MGPVSRKLVPVLAALAILPLASCSDERTLTQPPSGTRYTTPTGLVTANPPQILVGAGDISECGANNNDEATARLLDDIPGTVFTAGDNVMPNGTTSEYANCYDPTWGRHKGRTKPAAGNHDYNTSGATGYFAYFGTAAGEPGKGYYSYTLGAWHIVVLNSSIATSAGSAQDTWLKADLAAHPNQCTLAYYHHPLYSSTGGTGTGGATYSGVRNLFDVLYAAHADVVMGGHRHVYERIAPMTPAGTADPALGLRQFIVGTGGDGGGTLTNIFPLSEVRNGSTFGVLKLYLYDDSYSWKFVPIAGKTFTDSGSTACHFSGGGGGGGVSAATSTVQAAPASFTAGSGSSTITVTAKDGNGASVSGASVTIAASGGGNTLTPIAGTTDGNGAFTSILTSSVAEGKLVSATIDGTPINQTASVTVTPPDGGGGTGTIAQTLLTSGSSGVNQRVYTTASISPAPHALITVAVRSRRSGGPLTPTVTGGGMAIWTQVTSVDYDAVTAPLARLVVFRAMSAAPGSGPITITYANGVSNAEWVVSQWTGVDQSGSNGAGAIGQTASARGNAVTVLGSTLAPFGNAGNVALGLLGAATNAPAASPGAGLTEIAEPSSGENTLLEAAWGVNRTAVTASLSKSANAGLLAIELVAGTGGGPAVSASLSTVSAVSPITAGGPASTITVTARDGSGTPISGATVVLASTGSGNTLTQPSGTTNGNGEITGSLSSTVAEVKDVSATINGVAITQHAAVTVNPSASPVSASLSSVGASPITFTAGGSSTVAVTVRDGNGNPLNGVAVTLAVSGSGNTVTQPPVTDMNGITSGSFSSTGAGAHTVTAVAGDITLAQQPVVTVNPGPADAVRSTVTALPTTIVQGSGSSTITVTVRDVYGNPVSGTSVGLHATGSGNTLTGGTTNGSGVVTGSLSSTVAETKVVSATAGGVDLTQTATVTVTPEGPGGSGTITHTLLTAGHDPNNVRVYTTGAIAPAANTLVLVAVLTHQASAAAPSPTLTGGGMTGWDIVASVAFNGGTPLDRLTVYRAMSAAPGSGPITITSSVTVSNCQWIVSQWDGVDDGGVNGAGAIVQATQTWGSAVNGLTALLAPFGDANNVGYGAFGVASATAVVSAGAGFTTIDQQPSGEGTTGDLFAEWAANQPTVSASWTGKSGGVVALEIRSKTVSR